MLPRTRWWPTARYCSGGRLLAFYRAAHAEGGGLRQADDDAAVSDVVDLPVLQNRGSALADLHELVTLGVEILHQAAALRIGLDEKTALAADVENRLAAHEDVARVMTVANRVANTLNALSDRRRGRPIPGSRLPDELLINFLFLPGAWLGTLVAALRQRKSPFAVWRQARGYTGRS